MVKENQEEIKPCQIGKHRWHFVEGETSKDDKDGAVYYSFICDRCGFAKKVKKQKLLG